MLTPALFEDPQYGTCIRIHVAGGSTHAQDWVTLAQCASAVADGYVYIDRFSAIELRGIKDAEALNQQLQELRLRATAMPVLASPLSAEAKHTAQDIAAELEAAEGGPGIAVIAHDDVPTGAAAVSLSIDGDGALRLERSPLGDAPSAPNSAALAAGTTMRLPATAVAVRAGRTKRFFIESPLRLERNGCSGEMAGIREGF